MNLKRIFSRKVATAFAILALGGLAGGLVSMGVANAAAAASTEKYANIGLDSHGVIHYCVAPDGTFKANQIPANWPTNKCPAGYHQLHYTLSAAVGKQGPPGATGPVGATGATGPQGIQGVPGKDGKDGASATLTVTATTFLADRTDSGTAGDWAKDAFVRTASLTRQGATDKSKCGAGATQCWFYTGSIVDNGTFKTIANAKSPQGGVTIAGTLAGDFMGSSTFAFWADSDAPDPSLVPTSLTGNGQSTSTWMRQFFPTTNNTVKFAGEDEPKWEWVYTDALCEKWDNASDGNVGDILGVNQCVAP